jgi:hypothetical protein
MTGTTSNLLLCDRCGAVLSTDPTKGHIRARLAERELLLCKTHYREHGLALTKQGFTIEPLVAPEPVAGPRVSGACKNPECRRPTITRTVTASPGSVPVEIVKCQGCDARTCNTATANGKCDRTVTNPADPICAAGHSLMGGTA